MNDMQKAADRIDQLEKRLENLAREKSRAEWSNKLLTQLSAVRGLDNMVQHILSSLMQAIGADNVAIVYCLDENWHYRDIYGTSQPYTNVDKTGLDLALSTGQPQRTNASNAVENWAFPLLAQDRKIGAVCMQGMQLTDGSIFAELLPFFVYAGLMLDHEISSYSQLAKAHSRLQDSELLYRTLFDRSPDGIVLWGMPDLKPVQYNTAAHSQLGYTREEFAALTVPDIHASEDPEEVSRFAQRLQTDSSISFEALHRTKSGQLRANLVSLKQLEISGKQMVLSIHRDIAERKQAEEEMALMNFALNHIREAVYLIDEFARFKYVNREACNVLGYSKAELTEIGVADIDPEFPQERWPDHWQDLQEIGTLKFESRHRRKDGTTFPTEITANYFEYNGTGYNLALVSDITEQKRIEKERLRFEKQLVQTQKLESLGVLAGGVAHDFNNLLAAIMGHAELAKRRLSPEASAIENLRQVEQAAERAADLAKQMLAYSGKGRFVIEVIDLNELLEEMLHMLQVSISKKVVLRLNPYTPLPTIDADATQLRQIIMNLVINASEAIGEKSGVISITTGCMDCDQDYLRDVWLDENLADGLYVSLEVADTGCGMDKNTMGRLFDPFFTTKFTGRGLGMSAVMGIVRGHKGAIKVYSEPEKGTTFKILLPASGKPAEIFNGDRVEDPWVGTGKVLLVDDEETVRGIGVEMLKELGFSPLTANNGIEALEVYRANPDIALVILDLTMPQMGGEQCYRELRKLNPNVKVIISSGYNEYEVTQRFIGKGIAGFMQKPYKLSVLREAIKPVVNRR